LVWIHWKVQGKAAGTLGSVQVEVSVIGVPEGTVTGTSGVYDTVGADAALIVIVLVAELVPPQVVTLSVRVMFVWTATSGAVKTGLAKVASEKVPAVAVHRNVTGTSGVVALPFRVTVPPEASEAYGPPEMATGAEVHDGGGGGVALGQGLS
jgi:hypothetical protein